MLLNAFPLNITLTRPIFAGGLLAAAIHNMDGVGDKPGWAWIFILEGLFTVLFGAISFFILPKSVDTAYFLNDEEKKYINAKLKEDSINAEEAGFSWKEVIEACKLPQVWFLCPTLFFSGVTLYGLAL